MSENEETIMTSVIEFLALAFKELDTKRVFVSRFTRMAHRHHLTQQINVDELESALLSEALTWHEVCKNVKGIRLDDLGRVWDGLENLSSAIENWFRGALYLEDSERIYHKLLAVAKSATGHINQFEKQIRRVRYEALRGFFDSIPLWPCTHNEEKGSSNADGIESVRCVLEGIQAALDSWIWEDDPRRGKHSWAVDDEYYFQALLFMALKPSFPDLLKEVYLPSNGNQQGRVDFYLPSLGVAIEAKFWYRDRRSENLIKELRIDSTLYVGTNSPVALIIPVIWDEARRPHEQVTIQQALSDISCLSTPIFISRPIEWDDDGLSA